MSWICISLQNVLELLACQQHTLLQLLFCGLMMQCKYTWNSPFLYNHYCVSFPLWPFSLIITVLFIVYLKVYPPFTSTFAITVSRKLIKLTSLNIFWIFVVICLTQEWGKTCIRSPEHRLIWHLGHCWICVDYWKGHAALIWQEWNAQGNKQQGWTSKMFEEKKIDLVWLHNQL